MRKSFYLVLLAAIASVFGCNNKKAGQMAAVPESAGEQVVDSTVYGICGEGTAMHTLQVVTDMGDTIDYSLIDNADTESDVAGGLMCGDRIAVMARKEEGANVAYKVINISSLLGRWTSIDKNFVIEEDGTVSSNVKAETNPWTNWKILNGRLLLNKDTFDVVSIGADSLSLENKKGIFVFKRRLVK